MNSPDPEMIRKALQLISTFPFSQSELSAIEQLSALKQGKGWGAGTILQEIECCLAILKRPPNVIIDIGANKGLYTEELLKRFPSAEFYLFEPSSSNADILRQKFNAHRNVNIYSKAISDKTGTAPLFTNEEGSGLASLTKRNLEHFCIEMKIEESVETIRLEEFLNSILPGDKVDYIKIDIEGHELDALNGMGERIKDISLIQFEFGGCNIDTRTFFQDFWYFFVRANFRLYRISPSGHDLISAYRELDEFFSTTNYIAANNHLVP